MAQKPTFDYDVIVIGSGAGGSPAASILSSSGKKVAVIERASFGGESPNSGDIPTGAMIHVASIYHSAKTASKFGLRTSSTGYNYPSLLSWRHNTIKRTGVSGNRYYYEKQGISAFSGNAHFLSPNEITVNRRHLSARKFLIATGSDWQVPHIDGLESISYFTPKTIFKLTRPPKTLLIIGSSIEALELSHVFSSFGTKVYIIESTNQILSEFDKEVSDLIGNDAKKSRGINILTNTKVMSIQKSGLQKRISFLQSGREHSLKIDEILLADSRIPNTDLGLENAGVKYNQRGIIVDSHLQTSMRHIFAAGSVLDANSQTHEVLATSQVAAHNLLRRNQIEMNYSPRLRVAFTQPEIAQIGLNEKICIKRGLKFNSATAPLSLVSRSNITDIQTGLVKLLSNQKGVLIGGTIIADHASDIAAELTLAIRHKITAKQLAETPHCFTSWSEAVRIAAGKLL